MEKIKKIKSFFIKTIFKKKRKGMSMIEMMLVFGLVMGLIAGVMQIYKTVKSRMDIDAAKNVIRMVKSGIDQYKVDIGKYPTKISELVVAPSGAEERRRWQGPYVPSANIQDDTVKDTFGNEIEYKYDQSKNDFEVFSWGKQGPNGDGTGQIFAD